jgi:drug/metabolite transporter (DMT)-like permease
MPLFALAFVLLSSLLHATWNTIVKIGDDRLVASWGIVAAGAILSLGLIVGFGFPSRDAMVFMLASGLLHGVYNTVLARAYDHGDLSLVYPIARGAAPPLAAAGAVLAFGEVLPWPAYAGIGLVAAGVLSLGILGRRAAAAPQAVFWSVVTAACIALYTLIDREGIRHTAVFGYIAGLFWINAVPITLYTRWRRGRWPWRLVPSGGWGILWGGGACGLGAYLLVLIALSISRVGYVAALRETSVLIAAWIGWRRLGDIQGVPRLLSSGVVAAGLVMLVASR